MAGLTRKLLGAGIFMSACCFSVAAWAGSSTYGIGIEGFQDKYKDSDLSVTDTTNGGSLTAYYSHQLTRRSFIAIDGRGSYGTDDFSAPTGSISGIPQWEFELRARYGMTFPVWGGEMSPYLGLGYRYTLNQGKNYTTGLGYEDYDTSVSQFYVPVGASYSYAFAGGWSVTPQAEADFMFYGNVDSRLTNVDNGGPAAANCTPSCLGYQFLNPASNSQRFGIGGRGELMVGKSLNGYALQAGPFVRYWYVPASDSVTYQTLNGGPNRDFSVPKNTDLQAGVSVRMLF